MNIFFTSPSPTKCARYLDNKRVIKQCVETAQMLSTALILSGYEGNYRIYKKTHYNHPSNLWCRQTRSNFRWLLAHFRALCQEYTRRYGKIHKSSKLFPIFLENVNLIPNGKLTPFVNCAANQKLGLNFKHLPIFDAYRIYLSERFKRDKLPAVCRI